MRRAPRARGVFSRIRPTASAVIRNHTCWLPSASSAAPNQRISRHPVRHVPRSLRYYAYVPIATGKAPARRNAEIMVVQEVTRWRREVERFTPARAGGVRGGHPTTRWNIPRPCSAPRAGSGIQVRVIPDSASRPPLTGSGGTMRLIPHHQDASHGRPEYRSPAGTWRVVRTRQPGRNGNERARWEVRASRGPRSQALPRRFERRSGPPADALHTLFVNPHRQHAHSGRRRHAPWPPGGGSCRLC